MELSNENWQTLEQMGTVIATDTIITITTAATIFPLVLNLGLFPMFTPKLDCTGQRSPILENLLDCWSRIFLNTRCPITLHHMHIPVPVPSPDEGGRLCDMVHIQPLVKQTTEMWHLTTQEQKPHQLGWGPTKQVHLPNYFVEGSKNNLPRSKCGPKSQRSQ